MPLLRPTNVSAFNALHVGRLGKACWISLLSCILCGLVANSAFAYPESVRQPDGKRRIGIDTAFGELVHEAIVAYDRDDAVTAIAKLTAALGFKPDDKDAALLYRLRGHAYRMLEEVDRALADYEAAIQRNPSLAYVHEDRGRMYKREGQFAKAISDFNQALRHDPRNIELYLLRADAYSTFGNRDLARKDYQRVISATPKRQNDYVIRARAYWATGQYRAAATAFNAARQLGLDDEWGAWALSAMAWFKATCADPAYRDGKSALRDARAACERQKWKYPHSIETLAAAYAELGDFDQAIKYEERALGMRLTSYEKSKFVKNLRLFQTRKPVRINPRI